MGEDERSEPCAGLAPALGKTKYAERVVLLGYVVFLKQLLLVDNILIIIIIHTYIYLLTI